MVERVGTIGEPIVGVVLIDEVGDSRRIGLARNPAVLIVIPGGELVFAVVEPEQIAGLMVLEAVGFHGRAPAVEKDLFGQPARLVVVELSDVRQLIGVVGQSARGVEKLLDAVIRPGPGTDPVQEIVGLIDRHASGTDSVGGAVFVVVDGLEHLAEGVAGGDRQALVAVPVGNAVAGVVSNIGQAANLAVEIVDRVAG